MSETRWIAVPDVASLQYEACHRVLAAAREAITARGAFHIVLAGGSTPRGVYRLLAQADAAWSRWHVYQGDERCLPVDDGERNSVMARQSWLDQVPIPEAQVHEMPAERGAEVAANIYSALLVNVGEFDLVLLGLGEDGHTASLFPGQPAGLAAGSSDAVAVHDAPKPPAARASLSAARLSRSRSVLFLVAGESKREAVRRWRSGEDMPAAHIVPVSGVDVLVEQALLE